MTWAKHHSESERLAAEAEALLRRGEIDEAVEVYRRAAAAEALALSALDPEKRKTFGITAVSAAALWYKARDYAEAERVACAHLITANLSHFAKAQLQTLIQLIWASAEAAKSGVSFAPGDVLVAVKGGIVVHGGAPLDLIIQKVEGIQSTLYRTVEMLLSMPLRRRGAPPADIQSLFRPWLFQAPAGSYQFAVRFEQPPQTELFPTAAASGPQVTSTFLSVLRATATNPERDLPDLVPDKGYREAFLKLSRNLAPTGKTFERLEIRDATAPARMAVSLASASRREINSALRQLRPPSSEPDEGAIAAITGVLRAVHLDQDWIEVLAPGKPVEHVRICEVSEVLDDVIGPMVNHRVVVSVQKRRDKLLFRDIELEE